MECSVNLLRKYPYSVQMRESTEQKNSEYGLFPRSVLFCTSLITKYVLPSSIRNIKRFDQVSAFIKKLMKKWDMRKSDQHLLRLVDHFSKVKVFPKDKVTREIKLFSSKSFVQGVFVIQVL